MYVLQKARYCVIQWIAVSTIWTTGARSRIETLLSPDQHYLINNGWYWIHLNELELVPYISSVMYRDIFRPSFYFPFHYWRARTFQARTDSLHSNEFQYNIFGRRYIIQIFHFLVYVLSVHLILKQTHSIPLVDPTSAGTIIVNGSLLEILTFSFHYPNIDSWRLPWKTFDYFNLQD